MVILDVGPKEEYKKTHLKGAVWFDMESILRGKMPKVPKDEIIVVYCRSGIRATAAAYKMRAAGFRNADAGGCMCDMACCGYAVENRAKQQ